MREIKFRAWDGSKKVMLPWSHLVGVNTMETVFGQMKPPRRPLMQFTGLKDKNGKEIYEGDIVRLEDGDGTGATVEVRGDIKNLFKFAERLPLWYSSKVIGNIYENPELISNKSTK